MGDPLDALRSLMASHTPPLHALIVPSEDYHQSEYVSSRDKRRAFVSGFSGSAGLALITTRDACLWTDGRYFLQATQELSERWKLMRIGEDQSVEDWISDNLPVDATIGVDPWCVSVNTAERWENVFANRRQILVQLSTNLVDEVWKNRPPAEINPVTIHPVEFAGQCVSDKLKDLREKLTKEKACGIIFTTLDEVAWLYNVRGSDVAYCPVIHAFAIVTQGSAYFYVDKKKVSSEVHSYMEKNGIEVRDYDAVSADVVLLASGQLNSSIKESTTQSSRNGVNTQSELIESGKSERKGQNHNLIWVDPGTCCYALYSKLKFDQVFLQQSPLALAKAIKNPVELDGMRKAHIRDGVAVVQYLVWLDKQVLKGHIALDIAKFPSGTNGYSLDVLARVPLWKDGLDYRHGTGHGVGSFLNVHEGPHLISFKPHAQNVPLQASMTVTDEPGYYEDGNFGIRLENVLIVKEANTKFDFGGKGYLSFEHITWAPYQKKLMDVARLAPDEIEWVNTYHSKCNELLAPYLDESEMDWLKKATEPISVV